MFKKALAAMGIGNAEVDLVVLSEQMAPGYPFQVEINIKGGDVPQEINSLYLKLMTTAEYEEEDYDGFEYEGVETHLIQHWEVPVNMTIGAGESFSETLELVLHPETPVTAIEGVVNYSRVWIETTLDIENGLDATDRDYLAVLPTPTQAAFINAMFSGGYYLKKIDVESGELHHPEMGSSVGFYQEFEFGLNHGGFFGIQEVEASFITQDEYVGVVLEIDRALCSDTYHHMILESSIESEDDIYPALQATLAS